jgi:flagellar biosynthesis GTPase FlhF
VIVIFLASHEVLCGGEGQSKTKGSERERETERERDGETEDGERREREREGERKREEEKRERDEREEEKREREEREEGKREEREEGKREEREEGKKERERERERREDTKLICDALAVCQIKLSGRKYNSFQSQERTLNPGTCTEAVANPQFCRGKPAEQQKMLTEALQSDKLNRDVLNINATSGHQQERKHFQKELVLQHLIRRVSATTTALSFGDPLVILGDAGGGRGRGRQEVNQKLVLDALKGECCLFALFCLLCFVRFVCLFVCS